MQFNIFLTQYLLSNVQAMRVTRNNTLLVELGETQTTPAKFMRLQESEQGAQLCTRKLVINLNVSNELVQELREQVREHGEEESIDYLCDILHAIGLEEYVL